MGSIIPILECLLTILVVCLGIVAVFFVLKLCAKALGTEIDGNIMMILGAIGVVILLIIAVQCILGGGSHMIHLQ